MYGRLVRDMLNVGVIGVGRIGKLHIENSVYIPEMNVVAISDVNIDALHGWAKEKGINKVTNNYHDILQDDNIQAICICSPTNTHATLIKEAALAGKHIFCEKPISFIEKETKEALEVVEKSGVKLQVGFNRRFDHNYKRVRDLIMSGELGEPHILKITSRDPEPPNANYIQTSGGMFMDMTIHDFDMARFVMNSEVTEVYVQGANLIDPIFSEYEDIDTAIITLTFANGAIGVIDNSRKAAYGYDQRIELFAEKGCISTENDCPSTVRISTANGVMQDKPLHFFLERYKEAYITEIQLFVHSILNDEVVICSGNDGLQAERIAHAAKESLRLKQPVKINHPLLLKK